MFKGLCFSVKYVICGIGDRLEFLKNLANKLGISDKVNFIGLRYDIPELLKAADIFAHPSKREGLGIAPLEAMASGVPVISSDTGGLPELNLNGFSGYLSPVGDIMNMSKDAISILKDSKILLNFKKSAKIRASNFDIHQVVSSYESVYNKALKNCISI